MAKKKTKAPQKFPSQTDVFQTLFDRIAEKGLGKARLTDLARDLRVPVSEFYAAYPSVPQILMDFCQYIDTKMLDDVVTDTSGSKRDLYFDLMMNRMDTLQEYRPGVVRWLKDTAQNPTLWVALLKRWEQSLSLMLDMAKDSPLFPVKKLGLAGIYLVTLKAWMEDESADMAKTMAALDKALGRAGSFIDRFMSSKKHPKAA